MDKLTSIKKVLLQSKKPINDQLKRQVIWNYIEYKLKERKVKGNKIDRRGVELKYGWIAKHTGLTYKQVRTLMDRMVKAGIIEKWSYNSAINYTHNFYRLKNS